MKDVSYLSFIQIAIGSTLNPVNFSTGHPASIYILLKSILGINKARYTKY